MKILDWLEEIISAICLVVMTALTFANVVSRYVFSASFSFSEEITSYLFVFLSLLGTSIAAKRRAHLGLTILTDAVKPSVRKALAVVSYGLATIFSATLLYYGILMVRNQRMLGQVTAAMQWPEWIYGSFVPVGAVFVTIRFAQCLIQEIKDQSEEEANKS